jgi:hypothetical protein
MWVMIWIFDVVAYKPLIFFVQKLINRGYVIKTVILVTLFKDVLVFALRVKPFVLAFGLAFDYCLYCCYCLYRKV